jgi:hypothetical protein
MTVSGEALQQRRLRQSAQVLVLILDGHRDLPVLTWTVTPEVLRGHAEVCDLDAGRDRTVFTAWADALVATEHPDPEPVLDSSGVSRLRANRRVSGVPVILTAAVHPF